MSIEIQRGLAQFRKSVLLGEMKLLNSDKTIFVSMENLRCRRGMFGTFYWLCKDTRSLIPWALEINYSIQMWGLDLLDYDFATVGYAGDKPSLEDLVQTLVVELLEHEKNGDDVPRFWSEKNLHPNVVQVCKNRLLDLWNDLTIESSNKQKLPFAAKHRVRNPEWTPDAIDENGEEVPEYLKSPWGMGVGGLDDPIGARDNSGADYDENAEGASPLEAAISGYEQDTSDATRLHDPAYAKAGEVEDRLIASLDNDALLQRAMVALNDRERFAVHAWFGLDNGDLSREQIAAQMGIKEETLEKFVRRAVKKLTQEMERQQDNEQRSYQRAPQTLPKGYWDAFQESQIKVWGDLCMPADSYQRQLELRAKYPAHTAVDKLWQRVEGFEQDGAWTEPRSMELADEQILKWKLVGHFTIPAPFDGEDKELKTEAAREAALLAESVEQREIREAFEDAREKSHYGGVAYELHSYWDKDVKVASHGATWRECSNSECPYDIILVGRRQRIFLGGREKERGAVIDCPLCRLYNTKGFGKQCPLCKTQQALNTLCDRCFIDALPAEMARRRKNRVSVLPSLDGSPSWQIDLRKIPGGETLSAMVVNFSDGHGHLSIVSDSPESVVQVAPAPIPVEQSPLEVPSYILNLRDKRPAVLSDEEAADRQERVARMWRERARKHLADFARAHRGLSMAEIRELFAVEHPLDSDLCKRRLPSRKKISA